MARNGAIQLQKVISGGQTGVDRAALDEAISRNLPVGGWCPRGRRSEDGVIPQCYPLQETTSRSYAVRTDLNVRDSDGTLILVLSEISSGTRLTMDSAAAWQKPLQVIHLEPDSSPGLLRDENSQEENLRRVVDWLRRHKIQILNIAGPRGSSSRKIYQEARSFLAQLFHVILPQTTQRSV